MDPARPAFLGVELLASGNWRAFERALHRLVLHRGFEWARLTAGPGDRGSDIVGFQGGAYWVVQAKFSLGRVPPGPTVVGELARAINEYEANRAILATNASMEGAGAIARAVRDYTERVGVPIYLLGRAQLLREAASLSDDPLARVKYPLHEYQRDALAAIDNAATYRTGPTAGAIVAMATGTGKSRVMFEYIRQFLDGSPGSEVLVLVEAVELARQLERASWDVLPKRVSTHLWAGGDVPAYACGDSVTFATTDSIRPSWGILAGPRRFGLVVVDEAHHAAAASTWKLIKDLEPRFRLGMTATPWRGDNLQLGSVFGDSEPVFKLSVVDAIRRGFLAEVSYLVYDDHIDWDEVRRRSAAKLTVKNLNRRLWIPERENRVAEIVRAWVDRLATGGEMPRTIVFCRSIEHTLRARMALNAVGVPAAELHSNLLKFDVTRRLQQFRDGSLRVLTVVDMLNEGIDVPDVRLIVFNRVTHSRRVFLQQLGRGLRKTESKGKVVVLDFVADIRRILELVEMEAEYEAPAEGTAETVHLPAQLVQFQSAEFAEFVDAYLQDVGDLDAIQDDSLVLFPPDVAPE